MFRLSFVLLAVLSSVILAGCGGSEKELPKDILTPTDRGADEIAAPIPKASEPEAVKFVQKCLTTATDGHPERIEKLKANRLSEQGRMLVGAAFVPATRKIAAVWPDRFFYSNEMDANGPTKISIGLRQGTASFRRNDEPFDPGFPKGFEQVLHVDSIGQHWMGTLVPLTDPKTILFNAKKQVVGGVSWDTVQVAVPGCPPFTLWFDEKTNLLGVVTYVHIEDVSKLNKRQLLGGHKTFAGVQVPTKTEFTRGGVDVEQWTISAWEFPDKIEDAVFDQKK